MKTQLIAFVPKARTRVGHVVDYFTCLEKALHELNIDCKIIVPDHCSIDPLLSGWEKTLQPFIQHPYLPFIQNRDPTIQKRIFFLEEFGTNDLFDFTTDFFQAASSHDLIWLFLRYPLELFPMNGLMYADLMLTLHTKLGPRIRFITDSVLIKQDTETKLGIPFTLFPIPHTFTASPPPKQDPLVIWWPGEPRPDKGLKIIEQLLKLPCQKENIVFRLASNTPIDTSTAQIPIEFLPPILTREEYCQAMASAHILLLPYEAERYAYCTSGIFVEGIISGKMPFVSEGTWLSHELHRFDLGDLVINWKELNLWQQIIEFYKNPNTLCNSKKLQIKYNMFHSFSNFSNLIKQSIIQKDNEFEKFMNSKT